MQNTATFLHHSGLVPKMQMEHESFREGKTAITIFTGKVSLDQHFDEDAEVGRKQCSFLSQQVKYNRGNVLPLWLSN